MQTPHNKGSKYVDRFLEDHQKGFKRFVFIVCFLLIIARLAETPVDFEHPEYSYVVKVILDALQFIYYLIALGVIYLIFRGEWSIGMKIMIIPFLLFIFPPISMFILLFLGSDLPHKKAQSDTD
ncbi:MAG: hypothetical protein LPK80_06885 [Bacteroidota bacterium]|nr:hypothetical protein [Bacteroidota bacterium]